MNRLLISIFLLSLICFIACTHKPFVAHVAVTNVTGNNNNTTTGNQDTTQNIIDTSVCFERDILPIFTGSCGMSGCHNAATAKDGYIFTSYATIIAKGIVKGNSSTSVVYEEITAGKMPKSPVAKLDSTQKSLISRWINMGATDDTNCIVNCDTTKYTYAAAIVPILKANCFSCHATAAAPTLGGTIVLDTYKGVDSQALNGNLLSGLEHVTGFGAMPLGGAQLSECKITQFREWIAAGAQNN